MHRLYALLITACLALPAQAGWYLDNESSRLSFISTKAVNVSEVHRFLTLHGQVSDAGKVRLRVDLESVSTGIALRDERLRTLLFDTQQFAEAKVEADLDLGPISTLAPGAQLELRLPLTLHLNGQAQRLDAELLATRLDDRRFQVVTLAPLVLHVDAFGLAPGVERLREVAGLSAISLAVPVSAVLIFTER